MEKNKYASEAKLIPHLGAHEIISQLKLDFLEISFKETFHTGKNLKVYFLEIHFSNKNQLRK